MQCFECKNWIDVKFNFGLLTSGSCKAAPVIKFKGGEMTIPGFLSYNECDYPDSFEKVDDDEHQRRSRLINQQYNKSKEF